MAEFVIKLADERGHVQEQVQTAATADELRARFSHAGYHVFSVRSRGGFSFGRRKIKLEPFLIFNQKFLTLIRAGLPILGSIQMLGKIQKQAAFSSQLEDVASRVKRGEALSAAFEAQNGIPVIYTTTLLAGERSGNLPEVLDRYVSFQKVSLTFTKKMKASLVYPTVLLALVGGLMFFMFAFVVPQFAAVVRDMGPRQDGLVSTVIGISDGLRQNGNVIAGSLAALLGGLLLMARHRAGRQRFAAMLGRLPILRGIVVLRRTARFCRGLGMLLSNGVNLTTALRLMSEAGVGGERLVGVLDQVRRGGRLVDALTEADLVPPLAARMLRVGEESGALALVATRCADYYESKLSEQIDRLTGIVGPAAIIVIATVIGTLMVSIMSTLLSIDQMVM